MKKKGKEILVAVSFLQIYKSVHCSDMNLTIDLHEAKLIFFQTKKKCRKIFPALLYVKKYCY